jgi:4-hydroxy-tetrahydrodipicolinate reductase
MNTEGFHLAGATEKPDHPHIGKSMEEGLGIKGINNPLVASLEEVGAPFDVIIDFTYPKVSLGTAAFASQHQKAAVMGATGFEPREMEEIKKLSNTFPCVYSPNMSLGVNILFKLVNDVAMILKDAFDVEIMEVHHRLKKDAPSGTALKLAQIVANAHGSDLSEVGTYQRKGFVGERRKGEIGMQSLRAGDIVGEHTVLFGGNGERLELIHKAQSRDCFVWGALHAARWVIDKPNGLYDMHDVLGLKDTQ